MKKKKPLKETVTHYITASGRKTKLEQKRASMKDFFEDLENRGPFVPFSLFERFTKTVRIQMQKKGTWIQCDEDNLDFVAEYISRLLQEYRKVYLKEWHFDFIVLKKGRFAGYQNTFWIFVRSISRFVYGAFEPNGFDCENGILFVILGNLNFFLIFGQ